MQEARLGNVSVKIHNGNSQSNSVLLYLHGFPGPIPELNPKPRLAPELCKVCDLPIIAPEYTGLGDSDGNFSFLDSIKDAEKAFQYLTNVYPTSKISILGYSWGALPALKLWKALSTSNKGSLVLLSPAVVYPGDAAMRAIATEWLADFAPVLKRYEQAEQIVQDVKKVISDAEPLTVPVSTSHPVTVIHGTNDEVLPIGASELLASKNPDIKLVPVQGANHDFEDRDKLMELIRNELAL